MSKRDKVAGFEVDSFPVMCAMEAYGVLLDRAKITANTKAVICHVCHMLLSWLGCLILYMCIANLRHGGLCACQCRF